MKKQSSRQRTKIEHELVLATSIRDFVISTGNRRLNQPYWISSDVIGKDKKATRHFSFEFIHNDTDVKDLKALIAACRVWTLPRYIGPEESEKSDN